MVAWVDHHDIDAPWFDPDDLDDSPALVITQGWVAEETRDYIIIARDYAPDNHRVYGGGIKILRPGIRRIWELGSIDRDDTVF